MAELLSLPQPPTAVFAQSDEMAAGALQAVRRMGVRCPDDVSIVGFDDHELAAALDLTTMAQPAQQRGEAAASHLLGALTDTRSTTGSGRQLAHTRLVVRSSTGPPPWVSGDPGRVLPDVDPSVGSEGVDRRQFLSGELEAVDRA